MSYAGPDIASLRFLAANVTYQATGALVNGDEESDRGVLDDAVLMMDVISSYYTDRDDLFKLEWSSIQEDRKKANAHVKRGEELAPETLEGLRWRELKAQFRSLCRQGVFVRQESTKSEWIPEVKS